MTPNEFFHAYCTSTIQSMYDLNLITHNCFVLNFTLTLFRKNAKDSRYVGVNICPHVRLF